MVEILYVGQQLFLQFLEESQDELEAETAPIENIQYNPLIFRGTELSYA